ncbi:hypothetical protein PR048_025244 [Dryococelus australis]|uniref:Uncharacterized protein n=1 Tax=Dryococelus australis TaxID=614101 RepID=A0ABQ9GQV5_9NEOP|nr:hypothetical protein PR048_025244 [Dryococelus australis]
MEKQNCTLTAKDNAILEQFHNSYQIENFRTKWNIQSVIAKVFYPLGMFSPVTVIPKILFQDIWLRDIDWVDTVFSNASERAYEAVLYIMFNADKICLVLLLCNKTRLAPIKIKLPRLEFLAALTASHLLYYFCTATNFDITKATLCSDSAITLGWIRSDPNK